MEQKNRIIFVLLIAVVIAAAIFASFGPNLFLAGAPRVQLPETTPPVSSEEPGLAEVGGAFVPVEVTADTVQSIIATLERPVNYSRTILLETFSGDRQYTASAQVWVDGDWTRVDLTQQTQPRGVQHTIVGPDGFYRWYGNERSVVQGPADQWDADLAQRIPSYQDIIDLDQSAILTTDYVEKEGLSCVYVEVAVDELGYAERYWVSLSSGSNGLLMFSETAKGDTVVLRMTSQAPESPVTVENAFTLPDGTVLHQSGG